MSELEKYINAIMWYYGCNKKQAKKYFENNSSEFNFMVLQNFENNAKKSF